MQLFRLTRAFLRKLSHDNETIDAGSSIKAKIPLNLKNEPIETRVGFKKNDTSDFYESNFNKLYHFYSGYQNTDEYHQGILYADIIALHSEGVYPIRKTSIAVKDIKINISRLSYKIPISLKAHAKYAVETFKELGKIKKINDSCEWENNESLSFSSICPNTGKIEACKAYYFDQIATNISLDWRSKKLPDTRLTIRNSNSLERPVNGKLKSLDDSILANTLGVAVILYSSELEAFVRVRSNTLASITKKGLHCSASGVFEMEGGIKPGEYDFSIFEQAIKNEIKSEIGIINSDYKLYPVAYARELPRGGKPQLFFVAVTSLSKTEIIERSRKADESWEFVDEENEDFSGFKSFSELSEIMDSFTYEGWACLRLAEDFIEVNSEMMKSLE